MFQEIQSPWNANQRKIILWCQYIQWYIYITRVIWIMLLDIIKFISIVSYSQNMGYIKYSTYPRIKFLLYTFGMSYILNKCGIKKMWDYVNKHFRYSEVNVNLWIERPPCYHKFKRNSKIPPLTFNLVKSEAAVVPLSQINFYSNSNFVSKLRILTEEGEMYCNLSAKHFPIRLWNILVT